MEYHKSYLAIALFRRCSSIATRLFSRCCLHHVTTRRGSSKSWFADLSRAASPSHWRSRAQSRARTPARRWQQQPASVSPRADPQPEGASHARPAALAKADAARARQEGLPRRARRGRRRPARRAFIVVVCYDPKTTRVVDLPCNQRAALYDYSSLLPRMRAPRSCVTLHPPSPRRGDPRADQLDDVRALEPAPAALRADPLEADAARAGPSSNTCARRRSRTARAPPRSGRARGSSRWSSRRSGSGVASVPMSPRSSLSLGKMCMVTVSAGDRRHSTTFSGRQGVRDARGRALRPVLRAGSGPPDQRVAALPRSCSSRAAPKQKNVCVWLNDVRVARVRRRVRPRTFARIDKPRVQLATCACGALCLADRSVA